MSRACAVLFALALASPAAIIDSGSIQNNNTFGVFDADFWTVTLISTTANWSVSFTMDGTATISCVSCTCPVPCLQDHVLPSEGSTLSFAGGTVGDYNATGSGTLGATVYPALIFNGATSGNGYFLTSLHLTSGVFVLDPGLHTVPFTMTGVLSATSGPGRALLWNEPVSGSGLLTFWVRRSTPTPGSPLILGLPGETEPLKWQFTPEPSNWFTVSIALLAIVAFRKRRHV